MPMHKWDEASPTDHSNDLPQEKEVQILLGTEEKTVSERDGSRKVTSGKTISRKTT